jgi:hypothetical protein
MKKRVIILEESKYQAYTSTQVLSAKFKLDTINAHPQSVGDLYQKAFDFSPCEVIIRDDAGIKGLIERFTNKGSNKRNTEVLVLCIEDLDQESILVLLNNPNCLKQQIAQTALAA